MAARDRAAIVLSSRNQHNYIGAFQLELFEFPPISPQRLPSVIITAIAIKAALKCRFERLEYILRDSHFTINEYIIFQELVHIFNIFSSRRVHKILRKQAYCEYAQFNFLFVCMVVPVNPSHQFDH